MTKDLDRKVVQAMGLKSVNNCEKWGKEMRDPEDEAFEELALKQGQWNHTSGWRKKQIMEQAFPNPHRTDMTGMTLRDYFAAKAMQGLLSDPDWRQDMDFEETAHAAYKQADAMLKAGEA
jgi:hypothetical protein